MPFNVNRYCSDLRPGRTMGRAAFVVGIVDHINPSDKKEIPLQCSKWLRFYKVEFMCHRP